MNRSPILIALALALLAFFSGCAAVPYRIDPDIESHGTIPLRADDPQFEHGRPHAVLDTAGWIWGIPSKVLLLNLKVDNHRITEDTEETLRKYLETNGLRNVKVRYNAYSVADEWVRLFKNRSVAAPWRYTLGVLSVAMYTAFPGRFFGGDHYNPYTNTISLFSDHPAIALHEAAHAKDFAGRTMKGTYAAIRNIPGVPLYQEAVATSDALGYMKALESSKEQKDGYKILYPAYSTYVGGSIADFLPPPYDILASYGFLIPGHIIGRIAAAGVEEEPAPKQ